MVETEGIFDYGNGCLINYKNDKDREILVVMHEEIHNILYMSTSMGLLIVTLEKALIFEPRYKHLEEGLYESMGRMQEQIAVTTEMLNVYWEKGYSEYQKEIQKLKERTYYKHFRKMSCVVSSIKNQADVKYAIRTMLNIGLAALDVDLDSIPFENIKDEKDLKRFFSNEENLF